MRGAHAPSSLMSASVSVYWYCVRASRPPTLMSCDACRYRLAPSTPASARRSRVITSSAVTLRPSSLDLSVMKKLVLLKVLPPSVKPTLITAGSWRTMSAIVLERSLIAANEMSCAPSAIPAMKPVSCCGKKPLGMKTYSATVVTSVATKITSIIG